MINDKYNTFYRTLAGATHCGKEEERARVLRGAGAWVEGAGSVFSSVGPVGVWEQRPEEGRGEPSRQQGGHAWRREQLEESP